MSPVGVDYIGGSYSVTFGPEANDKQCFTIDIISDGVEEDSESFTINLNLPSSDNPLLQPGSPSMATVTISGTVIYY